MTYINFTLENNFSLSFEWKNKHLPLINDNIIFNTSINSTDVTDITVKNILKNSVFIVISRMWISDDEVTIIIKKSGEIK
jgi:hypothetical protein